jgi:hypothetical protein
MANNIRGIQQVRTMGGLTDRRRSRTSAGALMEMSVLESEKMRLTRDVRRTERRLDEIRQRLAEINAKQHRLKSFIDSPQGEKPSATDSLALPIHSPPLDGLRKKHLSY